MGLRLTLEDQQPTVIMAATPLRLAGPPLPVEYEALCPDCGKGVTADGVCAAGCGYDRSLTAFAFVAAEAPADGIVKEGIEVPLGEWATLVTDPEMEALVAAIPVKPPSDWFFMDEPDVPTPMTVTEEGLVYGHAAIWGTCHLGNPRGAGVCVQPPRSQTDYGLFHLGELETAEGERVPVGQMTLDTGHAPMGASARTAAAHYDDTGASVADVRASNGVHGIFYSGALRPDVTPEQLRKMTASKVSGDWRGGELVGMLCVNVPGFPVPRAQARLLASAEGDEEVIALVAAGIVGEQRTARDVALEIAVLAARAEGGIEGIADLAASGVAEDVTAAVEISIRVTDDDATPDVGAAMEQEVGLQVAYFRDHGYWSPEPLAGGKLSVEQMRTVQAAGAMIVADPYKEEASALRDRLLERGLLI